jgi:hypothetical protein
MLWLAPLDVPAGPVALCVGSLISARDRERTSLGALSGELESASPRWLHLVRNRHHPGRAKVITRRPYRINLTWHLEILESRPVMKSRRQTAFKELALLGDAPSTSPQLGRRRIRTPRAARVAGDCCRRLAQRTSRSGAVGRPAPETSSPNAARKRGGLRRHDARRPSSPAAPSAYAVSLNRVTCRWLYTATRRRHGRVSNSRSQSAEPPGENALGGLRSCFTLARTKSRCSVEPPIRGGTDGRSAQLWRAVRQRGALDNDRARWSDANMQEPANSSV